MRLISKAQLLAKKKEADRINNVIRDEDTGKITNGDNPTLEEYDAAIARKIQAYKQANDRDSKRTKRSSYNTGKSGRNNPPKQFHQL